MNYQRLEKELRSENLVIAIRESTQKEIGLSLISICSNLLLLHFHLIKLDFLCSLNLNAYKISNFLAASILEH